MNKIIDDEWLMSKFINEGQMNLHEWVEKTTDNYCEEQALEEWMLIAKIKDRFYDDFHDGFFCTIPTPLYKFLLDVSCRPYHGIPTTYYTTSTKHQLGKETKRLG